jgi:CRISPR-associated endoribonuclease Cas6
MDFYTIFDFVCQEVNNLHLLVMLKPEPEIKIPTNYNHLIQAVIYNTIDPELATFLHERGYESGKRVFKLFSFSRISGRFNISRTQGTIKFNEDVRLVISSPVDRFCQSIANGLLTKQYILIGNSWAKVEKINIQQYQVEEGKIVFKTLSPVVVYSTLLRPDGRKYTCYYQPGEPEYNSLITNNLRKKFQALNGKEVSEEGEVKVRALGPVRLHVVNYKNTVIKGYSGKLELTGPVELLQMAVDAGLGSKNSQGFGCMVLK